MSDKFNTINSESNYPVHTIMRTLPLSKDIDEASYAEAAI